MYVFKGQKWNYTIATDQTPCPPMQYTLTGKRYGMNLSSEGLIMWIPLDVKVYKFTVNLKDSCGLNAYKQFTVKVINCFCEDQSNGTCIWKNPLNPKDGSFCACPDECKGERFDYYIFFVFILRCFFLFLSFSKLFCLFYLFSKYANVFQISSLPVLILTRVIIVNLYKKFEKI